MRFDRNVTAHNVRIWGFGQNPVRHLVKSTSLVSRQVTTAIRQQTAITPRYRPTDCTPQLAASQVAMVGTKAAPTMAAKL